MSHLSENPYRSACHLLGNTGGKARMTKSHGPSSSPLKCIGEKVDFFDRLHHISNRFKIKELNLAEWIAFIGSPFKQDYDYKTASFPPPPVPPTQPVIIHAMWQSNHVPSVSLLGRDSHHEELLHCLGQSLIWLHVINAIVFYVMAFSKKGCSVMCSEWLEFTNLAAFYFSFSCSVFHWSSE